METKWCIALENIGPYIDSVLGPRYMFLKGERATKEKVFNMIPDMTEEEYTKCFRPATNEEINGEFEWDGEKYALKRSESMKSIKEKAIEAERNTHPLFESIRESDGKPVSVYDQNDMINMYEAGANYVIEQIEQLIYEKQVEGYLSLFKLTKLIDNLKK